MADDPEPPRKFYKLKPTEFERVNSPPAPLPTPPESAPPSSMPPPPSPAERIDVRDLARTAAGSAPLLQGTNAPANRPNDVHAMLRDNLDVANAAGLNDVTPPPKRRSRRLRDYLLLMVPVNAFFAWWAFGPNASVMTFVYGISGIVLFSAGLTWAMFFVMDDY